jgi:hypothetical protein
MVKPELQRRDLLVRLSAIEREMQRWECGGLLEVGDVVVVGGTRYQLPS